MLLLFWKYLKIWVLINLNINIILFIICILFLSSGKSSQVQYCQTWGGVAKMSCHFDLVEERIQRLENFVLGGSTNQQNDDQVWFGLLKSFGAIHMSTFVKLDCVKPGNCHFPFTIAVTLLLQRNESSLEHYTYCWSFFFLAPWFTAIHLLQVGWSCFQEWKGLSCDEERLVYTF